MFNASNAAESINEYFLFGFLGNPHREAVYLHDAFRPDSQTPALTQLEMADAFRRNEKKIMDELKVKYEKELGCIMAVIHRAIANRQFYVQITGDMVTLLRPGAPLSEILEDLGYRVCYVYEPPRFPFFWRQGTEYAKIGSWN